MAQEYVGIDLHLRSSVIYRMDQADEKIDSFGVDNEPSHFAMEVSAAPVGSDVIHEGRLWLVPGGRSPRRDGLPCPPGQSARQRLGPRAG